MVLGNFNGVGGGTVLYSAVWPRLLPSDFRTRTESTASATTGRCRTTSCSRTTSETDRAVRRVRPRRQPRLPARRRSAAAAAADRRAGLALARAHARLGWHWWPEYNAILSAEHDGRHACVQRGTCGSGCNEGAKGSTDVTHWPGRIAAGVRSCVTGARVRRIEVDAPRSRPRRRRGSTPTGASTSRRADVVLCAANGIGTARLLLLSAHARRARRPGQLVGAGRAAAHGASAARWSTATSTTTCRAGRATSAARSSRSSSAAPIPAAGSSAAPSGASRPPADRSRSRSACAAGRRSAPSTTAHVRDALRPWRAVGRAVRGPARPRQPRRALGRRWSTAPGIPAPEGHLPAQRRRPPGHRVEHRARHRVARRSRRAHRRRRARCATTATCSAPPAWATTATSSVVDRVGHRPTTCANLAIIDGSVFVTVGAANPTSTISRARAPRGRPPPRPPRRRAGPRAGPARSPRAIGAPGTGRRRHRSRCGPTVTATRRATACACWRRCARPRPTTACPPPTTSGSPTTCSTACSTPARPRPTTCGAPSTATSTIPAHGSTMLRTHRPHRRTARSSSSVLAAYYRSPDVQARARLSRAGGHAGRAASTSRVPERGIARPPARAVGTTRMSDTRHYPTVTEAGPVHDQREIDAVVARPPGTGSTRHRSRGRRVRTARRRAARQAARGDGEQRDVGAVAGRRPARLRARRRGDHVAAHLLERHRAARAQRHRARVRRRRARHVADRRRRRSRR